MAGAAGAAACSPFGMASRTGIAAVVLTVFFNCRARVDGTQTFFAGTLS